MGYPPSTLFPYPKYRQNIVRWGVILYFHTHPNQVVVLYFDFLPPSSEVGVAPEGGRGSLMCRAGVCVEGPGGGLGNALGRTEGYVMEASYVAGNGRYDGKGAGSELFRAKAGGFGGERGWRPPSTDYSPRPIPRPPPAPSASCFSTFRRSTDYSDP